MEPSHAYSDSYLVVEKMIHQREITLSELEHLLDALKGQEQITVTEQQALLALAWQINSDNIPSP